MKLLTHDPGFGRPARRKPSRPKPALAKPPAKKQRRRGVAPGTPGHGAKIRAGMEAAGYAGNPWPAEARAASQAAIADLTAQFVAATMPLIRAYQAARTKREPELSAAKIAQLLNEDGVPTMRGGRWHARTVIDLLNRI